MGNSRLPRKRVFLLGAGVSASSGIAVAQTIFREAMLQLARSNWDKVRKVHKLVSYLYPAFDADLKNYPNIEDFLNLLQMARTFNTEEFIESSLWPDKKLNEVQKITMKAITDYLWSKTSQSTSLEIFAKQHLRFTDVVITFNWDITLENVLSDRRAPSVFYTYSRKDRAKNHIVILKPHGSIDWYRKSELPASAAGKCWKLDDTYVVYPYMDFAEHPKIRELQPLIVPPLATKDFSADFLKKTWQGLYHAVADATELFIIGYSLPKEDQFARLVLRRAIRSNLAKEKRGEKRPLTISVVNPDDTVAVTFTRIAGLKSGIKYYQARFEDYTSWLEENED